MLPDLIEGYGVIFEQSITGMALLSEQGHLLKVNQALCDLWGYRKHELIDNHSYSEDLMYLLHCIRHEWSMRNSRNEETFELTYTYPHPSLTTVHLYIKSSKICDLYPHSPCYLIQCQDVSNIVQLDTKLQYTEQKLFESDEVLKTMLNELPLAVVITKHGIIQDVNPAALEMIHASSKKAVLGLSTHAIVDASYHSEIEKRRSRDSQGRPLGIVTYLIKCMDGTQKFVNGFTIIIPYHGERAAVGIFKDITRERLEEERLMQSEKLNTAGQLAAGIAHEIRNPLTSINGFLKLMRSTDHNKQLYFDIIESELKRIELIVGELLVLSKPQSSAASRPVDVMLILHQTVTLMKVQSAFKNIEIMIKADAESIWIHGEGNQIKQVFINLLKNGIEAMGNNGCIHIYAELTTYEVHIHVQDQGAGMTAEQINSLGQPFYTTKESGTGLGYMITQNIIHNHNGSITVDSVPLIGTTFTVTLPLMQKD
ncbi:ATP-binding protein [Paenibacillus sp. 1001270B_150601_E10]|uniref:ATP-binding protein n=1 Tax=Paenibacillus sp. 1001270B_150601_E10 TaxID=2787079 RepID=UPI002B4BD0EC|nr:ATP-binding protein [Paenibacillus sp. 1001270B_150601_E10]